jgi:hypothetical protein
MRLEDANAGSHTAICVNCGEHRRSKSADETFGSMGRAVRELIPPVVPPAQKNWAERVGSRRSQNACKRLGDSNLSEYIGVWQLPSKWVILGPFSFAMKRPPNSASDSYSMTTWDTAPRWLQLRCRSPTVKLLQCHWRGRVRPPETKSFSASRVVRDTGFGPVTPRRQKECRQACLRFLDHTARHADRLLLGDGYKGRIQF